MMRRLTLIWLAVCLVAGFLAVPNTATTAQSSLTLEVISNLNVRSGPGTEYTSFATIPRGLWVEVEGRNRHGNWVLVHTTDGGVRGWVASRFLIWGDHEIIEVPEVTVVITGTDGDEPVAVSAQPAPGPVWSERVQEPGFYENVLAELESRPIEPSVTREARVLYNTGLEMGNRPNVFSKVGDCHTDHMAFFVPYGAGEYNLGGYGYLQDTLNYFMVSPRESVSDSFVDDSFAAHSAFSAAAVMDSIWADPQYCQNEESPLNCEYRIMRPSVALIMFGSVDIQIYDVNTFADRMRQVVGRTMDAGIVPVLSTFPSHPDYLWNESLQFNAVIMDLADEFGLPLINLWRALRPLPNYGLDADNFHLSYNGNRFVNLNGDQNQWGMMMHNLVALQALDVLRRDLLG